MVHTDFALRRPVTTLMTFVAVTLIGLVSTSLLPLELFPDIRFPAILVTIPYEGSTPEEVERLITRPAEEAIATLSGIKELRSTSTEDQAEIVVFFEWGRDVGAMGFEVRTRLEAIRSELPAGANRIVTRMFSAGDESIVALRISGKQDLSRQYEILDRYLKKPLERIDGVARVEIRGIEPLELRVLADPGRLAAHHVDIQQLRGLLERSNFSVSAGEVTGDGARYLVRPLGDFTSIEQVRDFLVADGVRLRDVAEVRMVSPPLTMGRHLNGKPGIGLDVYKSTGANIVGVADEVMSVIEEARTQPQMQGIDMIVLGNAADNIRSSLSDLRDAGLLGAGLALLVLFVFLRDLPTTLIVSLAVPFSLLVTLAVMFFMGLSLNILTMMGMMLAVGLLVDNAVVTTESIFRHRQLNPAHPAAATLAGVREVGLAVLAGTLSTVIVFLPLIFRRDNELSLFMVHVAVPIVTAMIASLLVAQTVIPTLTARFPAPPPVVAGSWFARLQDWYAARLDWVLSHPGKSAGLVVLILASPVPLFATGLLKADMFPQDASTRLRLPYHIEGSYALSRVESVVDRVEGYLLENRERLGIDLVYSFYGPDYAESQVLLRPAEELPMPVRDLMAEIERGLPEIIIGKPSFSFEGNQSGGEGFSMRLSGESTDRLAVLAAEVARAVGQLPAFDSARSTARAGEQEIQVVVDRDRAARLGLSTADVAATVAAAMRGDRLKEFRAADREVRMRLAFRPDDRQSVEDLAAMPLFLPDGERIALGAVASFHVRPSDRAIERLDRTTAVVVEGVVSGRSSLKEAQQQVESLMKQLALPPGYAWTFGKGVQQEDDTARMMMTDIALAIVLIFLVMASLFESTLYPVSIVTSIAFAVVGTFWGLALSGTPLTFMAMLGIMILIGVVVNIGIVLIAHILDLRRLGMGRREAILRAGRDRLRPILMTTMTTLLAMLPLALGDTQIGGDGPAYYPMARALISGLAFGSVTALFFVPAFYVWLDDLDAWRRRIAAAAVPAVDASGP